MKHLYFEFNVLVNGRKIQEYQHHGNTFVEGRRKSNFELTFTNSAYFRVLVVPSVDGLSPLDGTPATRESKGYIVGSMGSLRIPGWTLDNTAVAKFTFQDKKHSYASFASPAGVKNTGVLGLMVFAETTIMSYQSLQPSTQLYPMMGQAQTICDSPLWSTNSITRSATASATTLTQSVNTLGTGFGEKTAFATHDVAFKRGNKLAELLVYYDDRKGLTARGIKIGGQHPTVSELPQAFGAGCTPPPGWHD
jgi:hypothetical protein